MEIGRKLRELRTARQRSQGDIEKRTGLMRAYTSRVENGGTVPNVDTLEKYARAFGIPLYRLFCDGDGPTKKLILPSVKAQPYFGTTEKERVEIKAFATALSKMNERDRRLLVAIAQKLAGRNGFRKK